MCSTGKAVALISLWLLSAPAALAGEPPLSTNEKLKRTFVTGDDPDRRIMSGLDLAKNAPDLLVAGVDEVLKAGREGDAAVLAGLTVRTKFRHLRVLLVWGFSELDGGPDLFLSKIDAEKPAQTVRAIEALGYLRDAAAVDRLIAIAQEPPEQPALQAARALARVARKRDAGKVVDAAVTVKSRHVRLHLAWAVSDILGSTDRAKQAFASRGGRSGSTGIRAKGMARSLGKDPPPVEKYKVKLSAVRKLFNPVKGAKLPELKGIEEPTNRLRSVLEAMKERVPGHYHLICTAVKKIEVLREADLFNFRRRTVSLNAARVERWGDRDELIEYYLIQYGTIMFLSLMGEPREGHRGWEEGCMDGWRFALDDGRIAVSKDPDEFMRGVLEDPPW